MDTKSKKGVLLDFFEDRNLFNLRSVDYDG